MKLRQKIVVFAGLDQSLINFRGPLLRDLCAKGWEVVAVAPQETPGVAEELANAGIRFRAVGLSRASVDILGDISAFLAIRRILREESPDVVLCYTIKPIIYGTLAAHRERVPRRYALITGLGAMFHTSGLRGSVMRFIAIQMYRVSLLRCTKVFAQNSEIARYFASAGLVPTDRVRVVPGSGVDTAHFQFQPFPKSAPVFVFVGRLLKDKGVYEFVAAARACHGRLPSARFVMIGDIDKNPASVSAEQVAAWRAEGIVEMRGFQADVRAALAECTAFVLPSYHEGMPRSVLEAMSVGRPVITTDVIGCRDTIFEVANASGKQPFRVGRNGVLVPKGDAAGLAAAMGWIATDAGRAEEMGRAGRRIAEEVFEVKRVNQQMVGEMAP